MHNTDQSKQIHFICELKQNFYEQSQAKTKKEFFMCEPIFRTFNLTICKMINLITFILEQSKLKL